MLQVIAKLEGPAVSQYCALRLLQVKTQTSSSLEISTSFSNLFSPLFDLLFSFKIYHWQWLLNSLQATLDESLYELAGELVWV